MKFHILMLAALTTLLLSACSKDDNTIVIPPPPPTLDAAAIGTWSQKADFPGAKRLDAISFVINGKGYVLGGYNGTAWLSDLWEYDPSTDVWTQKADFPVANRHLYLSMVIEGKAYTGMGLDEVGISQKDWFEYDPSTDTWKQKQDANIFAGRVGGIAFSSGSKGYTGGGWSNIAADPATEIDVLNFYEYDPTTETWTPKATLPEAFHNPQPSLTLFERGCFIASKSYAYDVSADRWDPLTLSAAPNEFAFSLGKFLYYGLNGKATLGTIDTSLDIRGDNTPLPSSTSPRLGGVLFTIGKKAYFGLGANGGALFGDMYEFSIP